MDLVRIVISALLIGLAGLIEGEREQIWNKWAGIGPANNTWFPKWKWWNGNNWKYKNPIIQWLMRYPLSFLKDGYHFLTSLGYALIFAGVAIFTGANLATTIYAVLGGYTILGAFFDISYHN